MDGGLLDLLLNRSINGWMDDELMDGWMVGMHSLLP